MGKGSNAVAYWMKKLRKVAWYIVPSLLSVALGLLAFNFFIGKPQVGVINISGIIGGAEVENILKMLNFVSESRSIRAVVLVIDSPGGSAWPVEEIYIDLLKLRSKKPVVASVNGAAASGGYYVAAAADYIYAKPTSFIGSVGAWMWLPEPEWVNEYFIPTGPSKITGFGQKKAMVILEEFKESFLQAIIYQRREKLKLSKEDLARAELYSSLEGVRHGLVDKIGTTAEAVEKAAEYARIRRYEVVDINQELQINYAPTYYQKPFATLSSLTPTIYYLYVETE